MMKNLAALALGAWLSLGAAFAQTSPNLTFNQVLTPAQWNQLFVNKQDTLGYTPINPTGGTMTGRLVTAAPGALTAGFNLIPGSTPPSPVNGDLWATSAGLFAQVNGGTVPLTGATSASFAASSPITLSFPASVVTYGCPTCGVTGSPLSQFAATSSSQLAGLISDETGTGALVFGTSPTIVSPTISTSFTATGLVGLPNLASQAANTLVGAAAIGSPTALAVPGCTGPANALQWTTGTGFGCGVITAAASSIAVGTTSITGGTTANVFFHNGSSLGEYTISGTGSVAMTVSPVFTTPNIGAATATTINGNTITAGSGTLTLAAAKTLTASNSLTLAGTDGKTLTVSNSLALNGTDGTTFTFPTSSDTLMGVGAVQTLTNKTLTSPVMTNPQLGTATGTSLAINGATIGTNGLAVTGTAAISSTLTSAAHAITSASANALVVGPAGATNPSLQIDASTVSAATGIKIKSAAAAGGVAVSAISSGANENLTLDALGSGTITVGGTSTGAITLSRATTLSAALTYGGVTLSNAVTGTGNMALSASPTFTGTITAANAAFTGTVAITSASASALAVGLTGSTNPAFSVDASTASQAAGLNVKGAVTGGTVAVAAIDSGANTNLSIDGKGSGTIVLGGTSTGAITLTRATTLSAALTYGGVALSNSVTGTGSMVLAANPTITGHATIEGVTATGATGTGNFVFASNPSIGNLTVTGALTATGLITYADMASAAIATQANYFAGASSVLVSADQIYQGEIALTFAAAQTINFANFINASITLTANMTSMTLSGVMAGKAGQIRLIQDATGSRLFSGTWPSVFKWAGGVVPTALSTAANAVDALEFNCSAATYCVTSLVKDVR